MLHFSANSLERGKIPSTVLEDEVAGYEKYLGLPTKDQHVAAGRYKIKQEREIIVKAGGPDIASKE